MIRSELISIVASETGFTQSQVKEMLDSTLKNIHNALNLGDDVVLRGFGTFKVVLTAPRTGRNINSNKPLKIKAKRRIRFKVHMKLDI